MTEKVSDQNQITRFQYIEAPQQKTSLGAIVKGNSTFPHFLLVEPFPEAQQGSQSSNVGSSKINSSPLTFDWRRFVHTGQTSRSTWREKIIGSWIARAYIIYLNNKVLCSKISKHLYRLYRDHD